MKFTSHQNNLIEKIENALSKRKADLVNDFKPTLSQAKSLYKTDDFDFWLKTLGETDICRVGSDDVKNAIHIAFTENLFWQIPARKALPYWETLPKNLQALYIGFHGHAPL